MRIFALFLAFICFNSLIAGNLVKNPGFEDSEIFPKKWIVSGPVKSMEPETGIDLKISYSGSSSLKMESVNPDCHGRAFQIIEIQPGQSYLFNARFLAKDIISLDKSVMIRIKWFHGKENLGYNYIYDIVYEPEGWYLASDIIKAVPGADSAEISLEFRWSLGTVWWDDISLEACQDEPARMLKAGTVYCRPPGPTVEENISIMGSLLDEAGAKACDIVCLPEGWATCNTGLGMTKTEVNSLNGSASVMMAGKARKYGMYIVSGLYNWSGDTLNNIAVLYNRQGEIQNVYKKVQLPDSEAEQGAVPGNELPVFTTDFGKIGMLICWDYAFPEVARILALKGAELLLCPIWGDTRGNENDVYRILARSRAIDNGVFFITSIYDGQSLIINPSGEILQESSTQNSLITADIDLNFSPSWEWIGNAGKGDWKGVWRKDRRSDIFSGY